MSLAIINKHLPMFSDFCRDLQIISTYPNDSNESASLYSETWEIPSHRFSLVYSSIEIGPELILQRKMWVLLNAMRQGAVTFTWELPLHSQPQGTAGSNPFVAETTLAGSRTVRINADNSNGLFLMVGDLIKFSNHPKCYLVMDITEENGFTLTLNAPLFRPLTISDQLITRNVAMQLKMRPDSEPVTYSREAGNLDAGFELELIEKL